MSRKDNYAVRKEHETVRNAAGYYDFTHKLLEVKGEDAKQFLDYIYVGFIGKAGIGAAKYSTMLNEDGIIIDDVIVFHIDEELYWVSTLYIDELIAWLDAHKGNYDVSYREITGITTMYSVQGPKSREILDSMLAVPVDDLKYFTIRSNRVGNIDVKVARSGYTGELGYEFYVHPDYAQNIEEKIREAGQKFGILNLKTDVIVTSLPREKGFVLMSDLAGINPLEAGFDWTIDWSKEFIGKEALMKVREAGRTRALLGFTVENDDANIKDGDEVFINGKEAGKVTTFTYGYTVEENIGFVLLDLSCGKVGDSAEINGEKAVITERIFYDPENKKIRP